MRITRFPSIRSVCRCRLLVALVSLVSLTAGLEAQTGDAGGDGGARREPASRGPLRFTSPRGAAALSADLATQLNAKVRNGSWGAIVVSLTRGDTLFQVNADESLVPASTMKLFTTALAFERLGPTHRFTTTVLRDGDLGPDGTLNGNLILRGGGDPALSRRFYKGDANGPMRALARQVAEAGIKRVRGDVIGDDGAFEAKTVPDGWLSRYLHASYAAPVSALSLNENLLYVAVRPGQAGTEAGVRLEPATTAYTVRNSAVTRGGTRGARLTVALGSGNVINVRGWIGAASEPRVYIVVVQDPATFTTGAFHRALTEAGIRIDGEPRVGRTPPGAKPVTFMSSPPLAELATIMNRESVNHYAELIFRNVARETHPAGVGSAAMANALLRDFLMLRVGSPPEDVFAADGSGLSTLDRVTPRSLVHLLGYANRAPWADTFHSTLPVAGRDEMLRTRMRRTPAQGNLHAKTGTTNEVIALSGYVDSQDGETLAFAFLYNGRDRWNARETIDAMSATLAAFTRDPWQDDPR